MKILILSGPNLNLIGTREPEVYGTDNFDAMMKVWEKQFPQVQLQYFQSNVEGELINKLHEVGFTFDGIIFNPGGYTHTSVALGDAVKAIKTPVVEVHLSHVMKREEFRHISFISPVAAGTISGFGMRGYELAIQSFLK
ncbi:MAG: type II 3-dehydroquinate dehydratase [Bacteroidetes bacterium]|jgi:3-dehydroquinate dehydratase-2|nr:type II 3-dehydroquinate dehydratase [Bacteroidota bacterium]